MANCFSNPYFLIQVLFLNCGDLLGPLTSVAQGFSIGHFPRLDIHINNVCPKTTARNIFILKMICSPNFDPNNPADLNYLWNVMNDTSWQESTHKRFMGDVKNLQDSPLPQNIIIPGNFHDELKEICT